MTLGLRMRMPESCHYPGSVFKMSYTNWKNETRRNVKKHVWDLYSNRMLPQWQIASTKEHLCPILHGWVDEKDHVEMLNLGAIYVWLDVLCLRQRGGLREDLRIQEWRLDVPTIGYELGYQRIIAGDTPDGPLHAEPIDDKGNYKNEILTRFRKQLQALDNISLDSYKMFSLLAEMQNRVSANPVDKVAGLAFHLKSITIPTYYENQSLEDAWVALVNTIIAWCRAELLFLYPEPGIGSKRWRPSWEQVMMRPLPTKGDCGAWAGHNEEMDVDWCKGYSIEKGCVKGLAVGDTKGTIHAFQIMATHQHPIPKQTYTLFGALMSLEYWILEQILPGWGFEKVSMFTMTKREDRERLRNLGLADYSTVTKYHEQVFLKTVASGSSYEISAKRSLMKTNTLVTLKQEQIEDMPSILQQCSKELDRLIKAKHAVKIETEDAGKHTAHGRQLSGGRNKVDIDHLAF
ncbi:hypothetical protein EDD18DRAFT_1104547 [Armillaria luteobubalina]|uniref:Heterokaryon incompatibility domain-containing protein n=1 Tax=Armillaria luteobubalina TaxID=153913 RepID=A0AA39QAD8_9AGAR|nr:hypothetical protein EDD18DRAFT_1104547 [Armillaria luteobubalina]